jgi:hypothetical protein
MTKSLRISLPQHHTVYLQSIASQMGCENTSEALNYLLWELRKSNYQFGQSLPQYQQHFNQVYNDPGTFEKATAMSALSWQPTCGEAIRDFEATQELHQEIDPVIARMASLIENF